MLPHSKVKGLRLVPIQFSIDINYCALPKEVQRKETEDPESTSCANLAICRP